MKFKGEKFQFSLVVHSTEVADSVRAISDLDIEDLNVTLVDLDQAVPEARRLLAEGYEVIIGHGGTGALITQKIGHSVVNIPTTFLEEVYAIQKAMEYGSRIAVTSFMEPREGMKIIENLLDIDIRQIVFNSGRELEYGVNVAIDEGYTVCVGGGVSRKTAIGRGEHAVIIQPNPKEIQAALVQARAIASARRKEEEHAQKLRTTLQIVSEGVIGIDAKGRLNFYNRAANDILGHELGESSIGRSFSFLNRELGLTDVLTSGNPQIDEFKTIRDKNLLVNSLPILIENHIRGAVALFREVESIQNIHRKIREKAYCRGFSARYSFSDIRYQSPGMEKLIQRARKFSVTEGTILIKGETGTGKELLAHAIHNHSPRKDQPFVAVNCAALPETLLESELFGYEEGAFTGAKKGGKVGLFELAHSGTIYLDEIGDITPGLQLRLLRVLEAREVMRVGGDRIVPVDLRVVASTHKDLRESIECGKFREDLYYRLAQLSLQIPPLRQRPKDIPLITSSLCKQFQRNAQSLSRSIISCLEKHSWPGNIRELNSFLESYFILLGDQTNDEDLFRDLFSEHLENACFHGIEKTASEEVFSGKRNNASTLNTPPLKVRLKAAEKAIIEDVLESCGFDRQKTADRLGIGITTLWRKLKD